MTSRKIGASNSQSERLFTLIQFDDLLSMPDCLPDNQRHFVLFLALDATSIPDDLLSKLARNLLRNGLINLLAWGPDCERVHDLFDSQRDFDETDETVVMTTWHADDSLKDALWYFADLAVVADAYEGKTEWIAATASNAIWNRELLTTLTRLANKSFGPTVVVCPERAKG